MEQSWILGLLGGLLIGSAGALYLLMNGRIMGASGILGGVIDGSGRNRERIAFLIGLLAFPALIQATVYPSQTFVTSNLLIVAVAGILVGVGTRIANGCTSGHGVCGISRLSLRGIVATVFYIGAGGLTVVLFRHILGVI
ncbi:YeeE/YedE family protein [Falsihalocynthiibacter sp. SS001]|uniref:YeeE/YedE family protein n=1 Tax=Falsihalocynthiibacter sp. SS001 TaxID=3349698 RepID=UPI0036D238FA